MLVDAVVKNCGMPDYGSACFDFVIYIPWLRSNKAKIAHQFLILIKIFTLGCSGLMQIQRR